MKALALVIGLGLLAAAVPASGQTAPNNTTEALRAELALARAQLEEQRRALQAQEARLRALEARMAGAAGPSPAPGASAPAQAAAARAPAVTAPVGGIERVGAAPATEIELPQVMVLGDQGSIVTRAGQFTAEASIEYTRADRNRALFRGIEVPEAVLIGVFDINESRQDVVTTAANLRYGITDRFEASVRVPAVYRSDKSALAPVLGSVPDQAGATRDVSADGRGIGDIELALRYQLLGARGGARPYLIANLNVVAPTGRGPFELPRDDTGVALDAATGSGFWGVTPSLTAILPTDPAVLFGTFGYTRNFAERVETRIGNVLIDRVDPGDALSASLGLGVSLNARTSFNLGYAHSWVFGTRTRSRPAEDPAAVPTTMRSRDLQLGRLLFAVTYRATERANINWAVEVGATDDAADVRTVLRIPLVLMAGQ